MVQYARASDGGDASARRGSRRAPLRLAAGFVLAALVLLGVFDAAEWYAEQVSISRYCSNPDITLELVRETLSERRPASDAGTRPYVVAAKLIYLIPRRDREPIGDYLGRLRQRIAESCR